MPQQLRRSLTGDRGKEMAKHVQLTIETGVHVSFAHPRSRWLRGTKENTNGLLRQYFPKCTDLAHRDSGALEPVAAALNTTRLRKTLGWKPPRRSPR